MIDTLFNIIYPIGMYHYLVLALILFCIGLFGVIVSKNILKVLICAEFMLNAVALNFVAFSAYLDMGNSQGHVFSLFIIVFGAAEIALAIAILFTLNKYKNTVNTEKISDLKG